MLYQKSVILTGCGLRMFLNVNKTGNVRVPRNCETFV